MVVQVPSQFPCFGYDFFYLHISQFYHNLVTYRFRSVPNDSLMSEITSKIKKPFPRRETL